MSVGGEDAVHLETRKVGVFITVGHLHIVVHHLGIDALIIVFDVRKSGMRRAVGIYDAIHTEVGVGRSALGAVVAAPAPIFFAVFLGCETLVHPVPNKAALHLVTLLEEFPIFVETAHTVAHCVCIFAENHRARLFLLVVGKTIFPGVHRAYDVGVAFLASLFVLYGARGVEGFERVVAFFKVDAAASLVAKAPYNHRRVVDVADCHTHHALHVRDFPFGLFGKAVGAIYHTVALVVRLVHEVDAEAVAEVVPHRVVGIVAGAHGVDVVGLHKHNVLYHRFAGDDVAGVFVVFVAVDALDIEFAAVHHQYTVLDFHFAESDIEGEMLCACAVVVEFYDYPVKVGLLVGPELDILDVELDVARSGLAHCYLAALDRCRGVLDAAVHRHKRRRDGGSIFFLAGIGYVEGDAHIAVFEIVGGRLHLDVCQMVLRTRIDIDVALDAIETEEVLILHI